MDRKEELINLVGEDSLHLVTEVIDEVIFLEGKLKELKKYPFIQVHPKDDAVQRATPASKQYKEFLQQYINCLKMIEYVIYKDKKLDDNEVEESPLRKWFEQYANKK